MPSEWSLGLATLCEQTRLDMAMAYAEARCDVRSGSKPDERGHHQGGLLLGVEQTYRRRGRVVCL